MRGEQIPPAEGAGKLTQEQLERFMDVYPEQLNRRFSSLLGQYAQGLVDRESINRQVVNEVETALNKIDSDMGRSMPSEADTRE